MSAIVLADVRECRGGACLEDRVDRGHESERRRHHFVARLQVEGLKRRDESGGAVVHGDRVPHSVHFGEPLLELLDLGALSYRAGAQDLKDFALLVLAEFHRRDGNHASS
jgi:hypothetical protein